MEKQSQNQTKDTKYYGQHNDTAPVAKLVAFQYVPAKAIFYAAYDDGQIWWANDGVKGEALDWQKDAPIPYGNFDRSTKM
jgi:hypothetical protein